MDTKKKNKFLKAAKASDRFAKQDDNKAKADDTQKKGRSGKEVRKAMYGKTEED